MKTLFKFNDYLIGFVVILILLLLFLMGRPVYSNYFSLYPDVKNEETKYEQNILTNSFKHVRNFIIKE